MDRGGAGEEAPLPPLARPRADPCAAGRGGEATEPPDLPVERAGRRCAGHGREQAAAGSPAAAAAGLGGGGGLARGPSSPRSEDQRPQKIGRIACHSHAVERLEKQRI
ncbi:hypothetical protein BS78_02G065100 [Paspalum vaginatum]|nr:hypothetical protein BS78_02G065100 [Paspalum vaginatum]KAJ1288116.1 hypothetical protein BS78_02G065100 [Paspalum vaginatum]